MELFIHEDYLRRLAGKLQDTSEMNVPLDNLEKEVLIQLLYSKISNIEIIGYQEE